MPGRTHRSRLTRTALEGANKPAGASSGTCGTSRRMLPGMRRMAGKVRCGSNLPT
jgi:hypothetical protein